MLNMKTGSLILFKITDILTRTFYTNNHTRYYTCDAKTEYVKMKKGILYKTKLQRTI